ncbi:hypothetical protein KAR34_09690 [bacterium]|nr:hypothetical protein [bacterium]
MSASAARRSRCFAVVTLLFFVVAQGSGVKAENVAAQTTTSVATVVLKYIPQAPELSMLQRVFPSADKRPSTLALSYYHSLIQICQYSNTHAGPKGNLILPGFRQLRKDLVFALHLGDEERLLIPGQKGAALTLSVHPGSVQEKWIWPDGLILTRRYYQSPKQVGAGIRYVIYNQTNRFINGLRFVAYLHDPEIVGYAGQEENEEDDELFADPREALLYQRDYSVREESWVGMGWSTESGLITAGERVGAHDRLTHRFNQTTSSLGITLETPAKDLPNGQFFTTTFWTTWGIDRDTIAKMFIHLRKTEDFRDWEETGIEQVRAGMQFSSNDQNLAYVFQSLKAWTPWMVRKDSFGQLYLASLATTNPVTPEHVLKGIKGLLSFQQHKVIRQYLEFWLDQRSETPDVAYTILLTSAYYQATQDNTWLQENDIRIKELAQYLADLDQDKNGMPEYRLTLPGKKAAYHRQLEFLQHSIASADAFTQAAELLAAMPEEKDMDTIKACRALAKKGYAGLEKFWTKQNGKGYYAAVLVQGNHLPYKGLAIMDLMPNKAGATDKLEESFQDIWQTSVWRTSHERYRLYLNQDPEYTGEILLDQNQLNLPYTHKVLQHGLKHSQTCNEAITRLRHYVKNMVLDPAILGMPGQSGIEIAAVDVAALNFIELLISGLCGLEIADNGLKVNIPEYTEDLGIEIKNLPWRKKKINIKVVGKGGGKGTIYVNGKKITSNTLLVEKQLPGSIITVEIKRKPSKKRKSRKKSKKTKKKKQKRKY